VLDLRLFAVSAAIVAAVGGVALACLVGTFFLLIHDASPFQIAYESTIPHVDSTRELTDVHFALRYRAPHLKRSIAGDLMPLIRGRRTAQPVL
jgi:hypothetical protein